MNGPLDPDDAAAEASPVVPDEPLFAPIKVAAARPPEARRARGDQADASNDADAGPPDEPAPDAVAVVADLVDVGEVIEVVEVTAEQLAELRVVAAARREAREREAATRREANIRKAAARKAANERKAANRKAANARKAANRKAANARKAANRKAANERRATNRKAANERKAAARELQARRAAREAAEREAAAREAAARKAAAREAEARRQAELKRAEEPEHRRKPVAPNAPVSVRVVDLHVDYEIFGDRRAGLRSRFVDRQVVGKSVVEAIRGVTFDVREGESLGVIGYNGSGKSTLLAAVAGVLPATSGDVLVAEEPRLMGVNAALISSASGYRNIRLGCLALGMTADEVDERIDSLVEFTGVGDAIHRPLKTFSSGMRARVHFAIATAVTPRILLIDEGLAVGDRKFRTKSRERIDEIIDSAGTLLMVNHSLAELREYCTRGLWLDEGRVRLDGPMEEVVAAYSADAEKPD